MTQYSGKVIRKTPVTPTQASASGVWKTNEVAVAVRNNTWPIAGVPDPISRSVRLRSSATAYFTRTLGTPTNANKFTFSCWVKRGALGIISPLIGVYPISSPTNANSQQFEFNSDNTLGFNGQTTVWRTTTQVFRDPSAWYHIVLAYDSTQATAANRELLYVNGVQITSFSTSNDVAQNTASPLNTSGSVVMIGQEGAVLVAGRYFDGYLTEVNFIDGQALTPSSFGTTDAFTGAWVPMAYTGTYGANGFYLNFKDNTSTATLGYDYSGNANNWTANNISLTAGTTYDSMLDVPTPWIGYNTDGGVSVTRGNYCDWNPLSGLTGTLTEANLYFYGAGSYGSRMGTMGLPTSGKIYFESTITTAPFTPRAFNSGYNWVGVALSTNFNITNTPNGFNVNGLMVGENGYINNFTSSVSDMGVTFVNGDVIGFAIDTGANTYAIYKNGSSVASGTINVTAGTQLSPMQISYDASYGAQKINFGQRPFSYTPPTGFKSLCTTNLPDPTISNGASYMAATLYTANQTARNITNTGFQPDFVWIKSRSAAWSHALFDSVRGAGCWLRSNDTNTEPAQDLATLSSFNSDGFGLGANASGTAVNFATGDTYVGWQWKANGSAVTNTAGSITSQVNANTTAGFSVVTYTGTGANATVGHGLGIAPKLIITKSRSDSTYGWTTYHSSVGAGACLFLNTTGASNSGVNIWNNTTPTSSVFSLGTDQYANFSTKTYVAYCWSEVAGFSKFGSYTGNGFADGPFVYCGFRPRWVMIKRTDATQNWAIIDTSRDTYNVSNKRLFPNLSDAEDTANPNFMDVLSNGFKLRDSNVSENASGGTYIFAAFAENPFKFSNAR